MLVGAASVPGALLLGLGMSHPRDAILRSAPSVPQGIHFFTLTTSALARTVGLLLGTGVIGTLYPAAVAAGREIAATLHAEVLS